MLVLLTSFTDPSLSAASVNLQLHDSSFGELAMYDNNIEYSKMYILYRKWQVPYFSYILFCVHVCIWYIIYVCSTRAANGACVYSKNSKSIWKWNVKEIRYIVDPLYRYHMKTLPIVSLEKTHTVFLTFATFRTKRLAASTLWIKSRTVLICDVQCGVEW